MKLIINTIFPIKKFNDFVKNPIFSNKSAIRIFLFYIFLIFILIDNNNINISSREINNYSNKNTFLDFNYYHSTKVIKIKYNKI
jgi:hypothetical protein